MKLKKIILTSSLAILASCAMANQSNLSEGSKTEKNTVQSVLDSSSFSSALPKIENLKPLEVKKEYATASVIVANILSRFEYDKKPLDKEMSHKIFDAYFDALDPQRMFMLESDVKQFEPFKDKMAQVVEYGRLELPFEIYRIYRERVQQRYEEIFSLLNHDFDFTKEENYHYDRKKADWPKTNAEVNDLWRQKVKNDILRLKLAGQEHDEIVERLKKRYNNHRKQLLRTNSEEVSEIFINAYADSTDPHTSYMSPTTAKNFDVQMSLSVEGIGAVLQKRDEYGQIREVVAGGPAAKTGKLHPGDRIIAVGQGEDGPMEDVIDWRLDDIVKKIRGKRGSTVRVEVIPAEGGIDAKSVTIKIVRDKVLMEDQAARLKMLEVEGKDEAKHQVGVVKIPSFYEDFSGRIGGSKDFKSVTKDMEKILQQLKEEDASAIVLDLRNNGGGSLREAANLSGLFIGPNKPIVRVGSADGRFNEVKTPAAKLMWDKPVIVIVNRVSASASEIFAGVMQDYGRGIVVGDQTWGKGTVQTVTDLSNYLKDPSETDELGALKWTIQKFFRVNGSSTQEKGVMPDLVFPSSFNHEELGESSYDNAMKWSETKAASYTKLTDLSKTIKALEKQHKARSKDSESWQLLEEELAYSLKMSNRKKTSLNFEVRKKEREEMQEQREHFNERRKALGETDVGVFKLDDGLAVGEGDLKKELEDEKKRKENLDTIAKEAANIAIDWAEYLKNND